MNKTKRIVASLLLTLTVVGCTSSEPFNDNKTVGNKTAGALGGAATGALIGQLAGKDTKATLIGAGIGTLAGLGWGAYRDKQEAELRNKLKNTGIEIVKTQQSLNLILPAGATFSVNSSSVASGFYNPLNSIASVFSKYPETKIEIYGYTDSTGKADYNLQLSQKRANSVKDYLIAQGIGVNRLYAVGEGSSNPVASNSTAEGRAQNRRVEIKVLPLSK